MALGSSSPFITRKRAAAPGQPCRRGRRWGWGQRGAKTVKTQCAVTLSAPIRLKLEENTADDYRPTVKSDRAAELTGADCHSDLAVAA